MCCNERAAFDSSRLRHFYRGLNQLPQVVDDAGVGVGMRGVA